MKTQSQELAEKFQRGSIFPIVEKMIAEFPEKGLQENKVINKNQFASYLLGYLAGNITKVKFSNEKTYAFMDLLIYRENSKKPAKFKRSLLKRDFIEGMTGLSQEQKNIYAALSVEDFENDEVDDVKLLSGFFRYC